MKTNTKELKDFIATWQTQGSEVADKVTYWNTLLELLGVPKQQIENKTYIEYEKPIKLKDNEQFHGSIDAYIPSTKVLIEQKSNGVDLFKAESRPNGGDSPGSYIDWNNALPPPESEKPPAEKAPS